jgi:hypothetical protein
VKIILEIPDQASSPEAAAKEATANVAPAKDENLERTTKKEPSPRPPAASSGNFGGVNSVYDPDKDNPNIFRFSYTEERR